MATYLNQLDAANDGAVQQCREPKEPRPIAGSKPAREFQAERKPEARPPGLNGVKQGRPIWKGKKK